MDITAFPEIKVRRLSEVIEKHIKELILKGEIQPGDRLPNEKDLSKQFGVSLVTVREALKGLETLGLIEKKPGKDGGIFVSQPRSDSVKFALHNFLSSKKVTYQEISEFRLLLEPVSIKLAIDNITSDEITRLEENIAYCQEILDKSLGTFSEKEFFAIEEKNAEFHTLIAEASRNPLIALTVDCDMDLLLALKRRILTPDIQFSVQSVKGHRRIVNHIKSGDREKGQREMARHIGGLTKYLARKGVRIEDY